MEQHGRERSDAGPNGDEERAELDPAEGGGRTPTGGRRGSHGALPEPEPSSEPVSQGKPALRKPRTGGRRGNSL